jgi:hypothetical protein
VSGADIAVRDSVTRIEGFRGSVLVAGSHGGIYAGYAAAKGGMRAVILNDAGVGRDQAGIGALAWLQSIGTAAATVSHETAALGDGAAMMATGMISYANPAAQALGISIGMACAEAAECLRAASLSVGPVPEIAESCRLLQKGPPQVWALDSNAMVDARHIGAIVITGSHGSYLGTDPRTALKADAYAALYNDACLDPRFAAITRLPALDDRGIAAATVSAATARIGDALSTYADGVLSHVNRTALGLGAVPGMAAHVFVRLLSARWSLGNLR